MANVNKELYQKLNSAAIKKDIHTDELTLPLTHLSEKKK